MLYFNGGQKLSGRSPPAANIRIKRIYDPAADEDGTRVLVDRLWPRGIAKSRAALNSWAKDLAPTAELRRWFGHDPVRWDEFQQRYRDELEAHIASLTHLRNLAQSGVVTLLFGARDEAHNEAIVLREVLLQKPQQPA